MMTDKEGNIIHLRPEGAGGILITGKAGFGKTFALNRALEDTVENKKTAIILDYSGSFSNKELKRNRFKYIECIQIHDLDQNSFNLELNYDSCDKFCKDLSDALTIVLEIRSYYQKKWLRKAVVMHVKKNGNNITQSLNLESCRILN